jgi:hypothetical protein
MAEDVRRRRAERVKQQRAKTLVPKYKWHILAAIIVVAGVGIAFSGVLPAGPAAKKFGHEHPTFLLMIGGQEVSFNDPAYDLNRGVGGGRVHMHYSGPGDPTKMNTWHVEAFFPGGIPDVTMKAIFEQYQVTFSQGYVKLDKLDSHNGTEWRDTGNQTWHVFVSRTVDHAPQGNRTAWEQVPGDYSQFVPRDGDHILITYGDLSPTEIARQEALVPEARP